MMIPILTQRAAHDADELQHHACFAVRMFPVSHLCTLHLTHTCYYEDARELLDAM